MKGPLESNAATTNSLDISKDPFAAQRAAGEDPFDVQREGDTLGQIAVSPPNSAGMLRDRRMSKEWGSSPARGLLSQRFLITSAFEVLIRLS